MADFGSELAARIKGEHKRPATVCPAFVVHGRAMTNMDGWILLCHTLHSVDFQGFEEEEKESEVPPKGRGRAGVERPNRSAEPSLAPYHDPKHL